MNIAVDITPISDKIPSGHKVRGVGMYVKFLVENLERFDKENAYFFFTRGDVLPENIDLVHYPYFDPFFKTLPFQKKYKTVVTVHDLTPIIFKEHFPAGLRGKVIWNIQKKLLKRVDHIITDSNSSRKDIIRHAGVSAERISVVYLAAGEEFKVIHSSEFIIQNLRKRYNLPEKFVLYVGDVTWNKNLPRLLDAIKEIKTPLVMVGKSLASKDYDKNNPWNADLNRINELSENEKNIIRLGFVPTEDLVSIYNLATVFVMPSLYEGFGLPVLEAMSCGVPVITTKEGSLGEVAGDSAFYVDAYDTSSIANGIRQIYESKKMQSTLSEKGLIRSKESSIKKMIKRTVNVYQELFI